MITGHGTLRLGQECLELGAFDYVSKPINVSDLRNIIERVSKEIESARKQESSPIQKAVVAKQSKSSSAKEFKTEKITDPARHDKMEKELEELKKILKQKESAFQEMLKGIEIEKNRVKDNVIKNVTRVILPILRKIKTKEIDNKYLNLIEENLKTLTSSFGRRITDKNLSLTPKEIDICNMIKEGMSTKEISRLLSISKQTIDKHRQNIRKKLGISSKDVNLVSYLKNL